MNSIDDHEDEERELDRMLIKAAQNSRGTGDESDDLQQINMAVEAERQYGTLDDLKAAELAFGKWGMLHKYIHRRPFRLSDQLKRSDQWREVARKYAPLADRELTQWLELQIDVATSREEGRYDQRIRRDGPCFLIILEYVGNRKRTALAVLHWAKDQAKDLQDQCDGLKSGQ